jgi:hypothetical protein
VRVLGVAACWRCSTWPSLAGEVETRDETQTGLSAAAIGVTSTMRGYGWSVGMMRDRDRGEQWGVQSAACRTLLGQHVEAWRAVLVMVGAAR